MNFEQERQDLTDDTAYLFAQMDAADFLLGNDELILAYSKHKTKEIIEDILAMPLDLAISQQKIKQYLELANYCLENHDYFAAFNIFAAIGSTSVNRLWRNGDDSVLPAKYAKIFQKLQAAVGTGKYLDFHKVWLNHQFESDSFPIASVWASELIRYDGNHEDSHFLSLLNGKHVDKANLGEKALYALMKIASLACQPQMKNKSKEEIKDAIEDIFTTLPITDGSLLSLKDDLKLIIRGADDLGTLYKTVFQKIKDLDDISIELKTLVINVIEIQAKGASLIENRPLIIDRSKWQDNAVLSTLDFKRRLPDQKLDKLEDERDIENATKRLYALSQKILARGTTVTPDARQVATNKQVKHALKHHLHQIFSKPDLLEKIIKIQSLRYLGEEKTLTEFKAMDQADWSAKLPQYNYPAFANNDAQKCLLNLVCDYVTSMVMVDVNAPQAQVSKQLEGILHKRQSTVTLGSDGLYTDSPFGININPVWLATLRTGTLRGGDSSRVIDDTAQKLRAVSTAEKDELERFQQVLFYRFETSLLTKDMAGLVTKLWGADDGAAKKIEDLALTDEEKTTLNIDLIYEDIKGLQLTDVQIKNIRDKFILLNIQPLIAACEDTSAINALFELVKNDTAIRQEEVEKFQADFNFLNLAELTAWINANKDILKSNIPLKTLIQKKQLLSVITGKDAAFSEQYFQKITQHQSEDDINLWLISEGIDALLVPHIHTLTPEELASVLEADWAGKIEVFKKIAVVIENIPNIENTALVEKFFNALKDASKFEDIVLTDDEWLEIGFSEQERIAIHENALIKDLIISDVEKAQAKSSWLKWKLNLAINTVTDVDPLTKLIEQIQSEIKKSSGGGRFELELDDEQLVLLGVDRAAFDDIKSNPVLWLASNKIISKFIQDQRDKYNASEFEALLENVQNTSLREFIRLHQLQVGPKLTLDKVKRLNALCARIPSTREFLLQIRNILELNISEEQALDVKQTAFRLLIADKGIRELIPDSAVLKSSGKTKEQITSFFSKAHSKPEIEEFLAEIDLQKQTLNVSTEFDQSTAALSTQLDNLKIQIADYEQHIIPEPPESPEKERVKLRTEAMIDSTLNAEARKALMYGVDESEEAQLEKIKAYAKSQGVTDLSTLTSDPNFFRKEFIEYLKTVRLPEYLVGEPDIRKDNPKEAQTKMKAFLGEQGYELFQLALEEEVNSVQYREAVYYASANVDEGPKWAKRPVVVVAGPSACGKTVSAQLAISNITSTLEKDPTQPPGNLIIQADGGTVREVSQIRKLMVQLATTHGFSGISDLHNASKKHLDKVKDHVLNAAYASEGVGVVIPETFATNPLKIKKIVKEAEALDEGTAELYFTRVDGENSAYFKKAVEVMGNRRALKRDKFETQPELDMNNSDITESKAYGKGGFNPGKTASAIAHLYYDTFSRTKKSFVIGNDLRLVKQRSKVDPLEYEEANPGEDGVLLLSQRVLDAWDQHKSSSITFTPEENGQLTDLIALIGGNQYQLEKLLADRGEPAASIQKELKKLDYQLLIKFYCAHSVNPSISALANLLAHFKKFPPNKIDASSLKNSFQRNLVALQAKRDQVKAKIAGVFSTGQLVFDVFKDFEGVYQQYLENTSDLERLKQLDTWILDKISEIRNHNDPENQPLLNEFIRLLIEHHQQFDFLINGDMFPDLEARLVFAASMPLAPDKFEFGFIKDHFNLFLQDPINEYDKFNEVEQKWIVDHLMACQTGQRDHSYDQSQLDSAAQTIKQKLFNKIHGYVADDPSDPPTEFDELSELFNNGLPLVSEPEYNELCRRIVTNLETNLRENGNGALLYQYNGYIAHSNLIRFAHNDSLTEEQQQLHDKLLRVVTEHGLRFNELLSVISDVDFNTLDADSIRLIQSLFRLSPMANQIVTDNYAGNFQNFFSDLQEQKIVPIDERIETDIFKQVVATHISENLNNPYGKRLCPIINHYTSTFANSIEMLEKLSVPNRQISEARYQQYILGKAKKSIFSSTELARISTQGYFLVDVELDEQDWFQVYRQITDEYGTAFDDSLDYKYLVSCLLGEEEPSSKIHCKIDASSDPILSDAFNEKVKSLSGISGINYNYLSSDRRSSVLCLQEEMEYHFRLQLEMMRHFDEFNNSSRYKDILDVSFEQQVCNQINQKIWREYAAFFQSADQSLSPEELNAMLAKSRKKMVKIVQESMLSSLRSRCSTDQDFEHLYQNILLQPLKDKKLSHFVATNGDYLRVDGRNGIATRIGAARYSSHDKAIGFDHHAGRELHRTQFNSRTGQIKVLKDVTTEVRVPSLPVILEGDDESRSIHDVAEKLEDIYYRHGHEVSHKNSPMHYNLFTNIHSPFYESVDLLEGTNRQYTVAVRAHKGVHLFNKHQIAQGNLNGMCWLQNISVNQHYSSLGYTNGFMTSEKEILNEATLMADISLAQIFSENHANLIPGYRENARVLAAQTKAYYHGFLKALDMDPSTDDLYFSKHDFGKTAIQTLQDSHQSITVHQLAMGADVSVKTLTLNALYRIFHAEGHHKNQYAKLIQALSIYQQDFSISGCKSANERYQSVNGRVELLRSLAARSPENYSSFERDVVAALVLVINETDESKLNKAIELLDDALSKAYNQHCVYGASAQISYADQGAASKLKKSKNINSGAISSKEINTNIGESSFVKALDASDAGTIQAHKTHKSDYLDILRSAHEEVILSDRADLIESLPSANLPPVYHALQADHIVCFVPELCNQFKLLAGTTAGIHPLILSNFELIKENFARTYDLSLPLSWQQFASYLNHLEDPYSQQAAFLPVLEAFMTDKKRSAVDNTPSDLQLYLLDGLGYELITSEYDDVQRKFIDSPQTDKSLRSFKVYSKAGTISLTEATSDTTDNLDAEGLQTQSIYDLHQVLLANGDIAGAKATFKEKVKEKFRDVRPEAEAAAPEVASVAPAGIHVQSFAKDINLAYKALQKQPKSPKASKPITSSKKQHSKTSSEVKRAVSEVQRTIGAVERKVKKQSMSILERETWQNIKSVLGDHLIVNGQISAERALAAFDSNGVKNQLEKLSHKVCLLLNPDAIKVYQNKITEIKRLAENEQERITKEMTKLERLLSPHNQVGSSSAELIPVIRSEHAKLANAVKEWETVKERCEEIQKQLSKSKASDSISLGKITSQVIAKDDLASTLQTESPIIGSTNIMVQSDEHIFKDLPSVPKDHVILHTIKKTDTDKPLAFVESADHGELQSVDVPDVTHNIEDQMLRAFHMAQKALFDFKGKPSANRKLYISGQDPAQAEMIWGALMILADELKFEPQAVKVVIPGFEPRISKRIWGTKPVIKDELKEVLKEDFLSEMIALSKEVQQYKEQDLSDKAFEAIEKSVKKMKEDLQPPQ